MAETRQEVLAWFSEVSCHGPGRYAVDHRPSHWEAGQDSHGRSDSLLSCTSRPRTAYTSFPLMVRSQEGSNPLEGGLAVALALALPLGLAGESPFPGIRRIGSRAGTMGSVWPFAVALAATRRAGWGFWRTRSGLQQIRHFTTTKGNLIERIRKAPAMVPDELRHGGPYRPVCQDDLLERPEGCVHGRCQ